MATSSPRVRQVTQMGSVHHFQAQLKMLLCSSFISHGWAKHDFLFLMPLRKKTPAVVLHPQSRSGVCVCCVWSKPQYSAEKQDLLVHCSSTCPAGWENILWSLLEPCLLCLALLPGACPTLSSLHHPCAHAQKGPRDNFSGSTWMGLIFWDCWKEGRGHNHPLPS